MERRHQAIVPFLVLILLFVMLIPLGLFTEDDPVNPISPDPGPEPEPEPVLLLGCTDATAENYNATVTTDDGSCTYPPDPIAGCLDPTATNYDASATLDDGSCTYPPPPIEGCTNEDATNFDSTAEVDDGSCVFPPPDIPGCMDPNATNYDSTATVNDGSCTYPPPPVEGCMDPNATNYNPAAEVDDGSCTFPPPDIPGCMDPNATNYDSAATLDDGSCVFPPVEGCTYPSALNFDPLAIVFNDSCVFPGPQAGLDNATIDQAMGEIKILVMMGKLSNQTPITTPAEEVALMEFVTEWYEDASFGQVTFNVTYTGWFNLSSQLLWKAQWWEETLNLGFVLEDYDLYVLGTQQFYPPGVSAGGNANSVGVGSATRQLSNGTTIQINGSIFGTYTFQPGNEGVMVHEFGHCLGLHHAGYTSGYTGQEHAYRNADDSMGDGAFYGQMQFGAQSKAKLGWIPEADIITTVSNGTHFISDVEFPGAGGLRTPIPGDTTGERWYWIGARSASGNGDSTGEIIQTYPQNNPRIAYANALFSAGADTWALDATPETQTNATGLDTHLMPGRTWSDPTGTVHFTVTSANETGIWVQVKITLAGAANQAPVITSLTATIDANNPLLVHYNITAFDPEGENLTVFWSAANAARYQQTYSSQSRFDAGFSISKEYNNDNGRRVWVWVSDGAGGVTKTWVDVFGYNSTAPIVDNITRSIYDDFLVVFFAHYSDWDLCESTWDFGDGSATQQGDTPMHTYAQAGAYTVTLTVTDGEHSVTVTRVINVN